MKLYTKAELENELKNGSCLDQLLKFTDGQCCTIFKADEYQRGDQVIYIPDVDLNLIDIFNKGLDDSEIRLNLLYCYTGEEIYQICGRDEEMAKRTFEFCDWQNPSTGYEDLLLMDEYDTCPCDGCVYFSACGDYTREAPCAGRKVM